jgi:hypothetical protein
MADRTRGVHLLQCRGAGLRLSIQYERDYQRGLYANRHSWRR